VADLEPTITLPWLVQLRWLFLAGQLALFPIAHWGFDVELEWWELGLAVAGAAASNLAIARLHRRTTSSSARLMGGVLVLDTALLTLLLAASGGAMNPFTVFYLVYVTVSAVVLSTRWTMSIAALSLAGFALLFLVTQPRAHIHAGSVAFQRHLQSMWGAYALAAALVTFFIGKITRAIALQRDQIAMLREANARNARLAGLTTLAAGAAHELGSPLTTIEVAAHEAELRAAKLPGAGAIVDDLKLIRLEVDRCQNILHQMAARAAQTGESEPLSAGRLVEHVRELLGDDRGKRVEFRITAGDVRFGRAVQMAQSLAALIKNALDASAPSSIVVVTMTRETSEVAITVEDRGPGIPEDVLARIGEPFFTTKQPGFGLGLGVFLARTFVESRGGGLVIESTPGIGTRAIVRMPAEEVA
jgi:two-component system sensor histidine kinase RegB